MAGHDGRFSGKGSVSYRILSETKEEDHANAFSWPGWICAFVRLFAAAASARDGLLVDEETLNFLDSKMETFIDFVKSA